MIIVNTPCLHAFVTSSWKGLIIRCMHRGIWSRVGIEGNQILKILRTEEDRNGLICTRVSVLIKNVIKQNKQTKMEFTRILTR